MLPEGIDEVAVVDGAAAAGVRVYGLRRYRLSGPAGPAGLVFGYGADPEADIDARDRVVGRVVDVAMSPRRY